ncbi:hypothetical protein M8C21_021093 [Ambrosia artemisiifolia]|uniref:Uncharacterized protein n=1 Tax=Ambrosia artemisiifolia TaxID=4212 RepID=A0AAD5CBC0_AMBAR|nr:hypothetical protein M8C21_021093 [Ambrosia artemisiifolia]
MVNTTRIILQKQMLHFCVRGARIQVDALAKLTMI